MILRNVTITIAEIEINESPARPVGERPEPRGNEPVPAPLAASTSDTEIPESTGQLRTAGGALPPYDGSNGGSHVDHQDGSPVEISAAHDGGVTDDCESPAAGEKAAHVSGESHDAGLTAEPEVPSLGPPVTIPAISDEVAMERMLDAAASWNDALRRARA